MKACDFEPGFISQLNMYQNVVNNVLRHPDDMPKALPEELRSSLSSIEEIEKELE